MRYSLFKQIFFSFFLLSGCLFGQDFQSFVGSLNSTPSPQRQARVDSFFATNNQYPYLENDTIANFILKGAYNSVALAGDMNSWDPSVDLFSNVSATDLWYLVKHYPSNARLDYKYVANSNWILDPRNPNRVSGGFGPNSELAMPEYIQPWEIIDRPNVPKGQLSTHSIQSNILNATYQVQIYLPPAYDPSSNYPTAYFHDGQEYISLASANHIIDNLIDSNKIEPIIGVFVRPNNRNDEYAFQLKSAYKDFFTTELVPWVDSLYATRQDSSQRATIGASFGGNISAFIAFSRPDLFYKHGQHSGAWWPNNYETLQLVASDAVHWDLQMASVWGSFEGGLTNMWGFLSDSMTFYQYPNKYFQEYPEGHSWGLWRATLDEILIQLFPLTTNIGFDEFDNIAKQIFKPFPNPARTNIQLRSEDIFEGDISYSITNLNGQIIISGKWPDQGLNVQNLASGLYLLHLKTSETNEYHRLLID